MASEVESSFGIVVDPGCVVEAKFAECVSHAHLPKRKTSPRKRRRQAGSQAGVSDLCRARSPNTCDESFEEFLDKASRQVPEESRNDFRVLFMEASRTCDTSRPWPQELLAFRIASLQKDHQALELGEKSLLVVQNALFRKCQLRQDAFAVLYRDAIRNATTGFASSTKMMDEAVRLTKLFEDDLRQYVKGGAELAIMRNVVDCAADVYEHVSAPLRQDFAYRIHSALCSHKKWMRCFSMN